MKKHFEEWVVLTKARREGKHSTWIEFRRGTFKEALSAAQRYQESEKPAEFSIESASGKSRTLLDGKDLEEASK